MQVRLGFIRWGHTDHFPPLFGFVPKAVYCIESVPDFFSGFFGPIN